VGPFSLENGDSSSFCGEKRFLTFFKILPKLLFLTVEEEEEEVRTGRSVSRAVGEFGEYSFLSLFISRVGAGVSGCGLWLFSDSREFKECHLFP